MTQTGARTDCAAAERVCILQTGNISTAKTVHYIAIAILVVCVLILCAVIFIIISRKRAAGAAAGSDAQDAAPVNTDPLQHTFELMPEPTPAPVPFIQFNEGAGDAFVQSGYRHDLGTVFSLGGTVVSNYPITAVTVSVSCAYNNDNDIYPYKKTVHPSQDGVLSFSLRDSATRENKSLSDSVNFREFQTGVHTMKLIVTTAAQKSEEVLRVKFYVFGDDWLELTDKDFNNSYDEALAFFKEPGRFVYRYQWVNGRYTLADPDWEETYITTMPGLPAGSEWRVHIDAVPHLMQAIEYLTTSYVRVHGTNGDSGVIAVSDLVSEYNGAYVSRFTSSLKSVSHHSFGAAVDLNASLEPNKNTLENKSIIYTDVSKHLRYNGIGYSGGLPYYDYSYDGEYANESHAVPQTCVNYLLYELGFYRAGFLWAHYYSTTSDAMHFTLSEQVSGGSFDGKKSLRKVFEYAPAVIDGKIAEAADSGEISSPSDASAASPSPSGTGSGNESPASSSSAGAGSVS